MCLSFEAKYYADRLRVINPHGDVGIVTLWTPVKTAIGYLERVGIDLDPTTSRVSAIGNLYGDGLQQLLCDLLYNPQITTLLIFGQDLSNSANELVRILTLGVEKVEHLGRSRNRIIGTDRCIDPIIPIEYLVGKHKIYHLGKPSDVTGDSIKNFFFILNQDIGKKQYDYREKDRVLITLPEYKPQNFPSEPRSHSITRRTPLDAWEEVVCRVMRFGIPSISGRTKKRLELQNMKVVITDPSEEDEKHLGKYGFSLEEMTQYQKQLLDEYLQEGLSYSYGNRLRGYFKAGGYDLTVDQLERISDRLKSDPTTRKAYATLWSPSKDSITPDSTPCLVSLFFRVFEEKLTLTATFRSHNVMSAWLKNVYGLMAIQQLVSKKSGDIPCGAITVISHSISIDPTSLEKYELAQTIVSEKKDTLELDRDTGKRSLREDPNGYFVFTLDEDQGRSSQISNLAERHL